MTIQEVRERIVDLAYDGLHLKREVLEKILEEWGDSRYNEGYDLGQEWGWRD